MWDKQRGKEETEVIRQNDNQIGLYWNQTWLFDLLQDEIEILYENSDRSISGKALFSQWKIEACTEKECELSSRQLLPDITVALKVRVTYRIEASVMVKKITCFQNNISNLYIGVTQKIRHPKTRQIWSFGATENVDSCIYGSFGSQPFPAAGMVLQSGEVLGILMDTGISNEWSRWHTRRTANGNAPVVTAYDPILMEESKKGEEIQLHGGQYYPTYAISFEAVETGKAIGLARKDYGYLLEFDVCQAPCTVSLMAEGQPVVQGIYEERGRQVLRIPPFSENTLFTAEWKEGAIAPLRLYEQKREAGPWHRLEQGREKNYQYFFWLDCFDITLRNLRKYAQVRQAEALGFSGTTAEKILYADFRMLNWQAEPGFDKPLCVPSIAYFEMYFRDVFWSVNGTEDRELNHTILKMIEATIDHQNWSDNIITPYYGSMEKVDNEINYLYVLWSYLNQKRYGIAPNLSQVKGVIQLLLDRYDPNRRGIVKINNPQSLMDVMWQDEPSFFAVSQGYYCLTMKTALALGIAGVDEAYVEKTRKGYQDYYREDANGCKYLQTFLGNGLGENGEDLGIISCLDLEPEFLSLYLFGESLLGKEIVINTLNQIPVFADCLMPIIAYADGTFFTEQKNPFNGNHFWEAGCYANGGSYLRPEYIVLATGKYHGWKPADEMMKKRIKAELETCIDYPVSMEYLHTLGEPQKSSGHKVFAWNVFVNEINRWIRETIDPKFQVGEDIL